MTAVPTIDLDVDAVEKILVCQLRQIGDVVLSTPAISLLRQKFPHAEIHMLTMKVNEAVLRGNPDIDRLWLIDKKDHSKLTTQVGFYLEVARERFDIIVDFQQLPRIRNVVALSRFFAPRGKKQVRLSYTPPWYNRLFYTHHCPMLKGYAAMAKASVLRPLGIEWNGERPRVHLTRGEMAWAKATLRDDYGVTSDHVLITVDPSHRRATRRWSAEQYGRLCKLAAQQDKRLRFLLFYGPGEKPDAEAVARAAGTDAVILPEAMFTIREMAALIASATLHIGNCSAPRHIAVGVDTPTFVVLGSTGGAWTFPAPEHEHITKGLSCQPCNENTCPLGTTACLHDLAPETVLPELIKRVNRYSGDN
ncbi:glycosyltransferase family 9 protein [Desulfobaculum sp. SPO524]|uniref:glycosyltransferase family 9 protein n=1 Tax=Desulfobaculum sp. SPO524 TaxID=3378071 RepID=UPI0038536B82